MVMNDIKFYRVSKEPYDCFSNFYPSPIHIDEELWPTVEHYFQAMKFPHHKEIREIIRTTPKAIEKKQIANKQYAYLVDWNHWNKIKDQIIYKALKAKFEQHKNLQQILLSTDNAPIIEHSKKDSYWADGSDGTGQNMLGKSLMKLRNEVKNALS
jgi:N-glycosidase YbiA